MIGYLGPNNFQDKDSLLRYAREKLLDRRMVAVDVETVSLDITHPVGLSITPSSKESFYFTIEPEFEDNIPWEVLVNPQVKKVFHNAPFDLTALNEFTIDLSNISDTATICRLLNQPAKLTEVTALLLPGMEVHDITEYMGNSGTTLEIPTDVLARKCCQDGMATYALYEKLVDFVDKDYLDVEMKVIPILRRMSQVGIKIDHEERRRLERKYEEDKEYYLGVCKDIGFNPGSPQQVGFTVAKRGNLLPIRRRRNQKTGKLEYKIKTGEEYLEKLNDPLAQVVLGFRGASKILSTYIRPLEIHDRAYCRWHTDAITGRITSTHRNMQNIPPEIRSMFVPDSGVFTDWDATQIELRCLAYISGDEEMLEVFRSGGDIHQDSVDFFGEHGYDIPRRTVKNVNFAMIYGGSDSTIMETAKIQSRSLAHTLKELWFDRYKDAGLWIMETQEEGLRYGMVKTLYGRVIKLPTLVEEREDGIRRKAVNYVIQGSAAEIIKRAMIKCSHLPLVLQAHDELVADGNVAEEVAGLGLEGLSPIHIPYQIKLVERWE